jgi:hypothetical protein
MGNTCDECKYHNLFNGYCSLVGEFRHSCGEDACDHFELADDIKEMNDLEQGW